MAEEQNFVIHSIETTFRKLLVDDGASHFPDVGEAEVPRGVMQQQHRLPAQPDLEVEGDAAAAGSSSPRRRQRAGRPEQRRGAHRELPAGGDGDGGARGRRGERRAPRRKVWRPPRRRRSSSPAKFQGSPRRPAAPG